MSNDKAKIHHADAGAASPVDLLCMEDAVQFQFMQDNPRVHNVAIAQPQTHPVTTNSTSTSVPVVVGKNDILCFSSGRFQSKVHRQSLYNMFVKDNVYEWRSKDNKKKYCRELLGKLMERGGRFLAKGKDGMWKIISEEAVLEKMEKSFVNHSRRLKEKERTEKPPPSSSPTKGDCVAGPMASVRDEGFGSDVSKMTPPLKDDNPNCQRKQQLSTRIVSAKKNNTTTTNGKSIGRTGTAATAQSDKDLPKNNVAGGAVIQPSATTKWRRKTTIEHQEQPMIEEEGAEVSETVAKAAITKKRTGNFSFPVAANDPATKRHCTTGPEEKQNDPSMADQSNDEGEVLDLEEEDADSQILQRIQKINEATEEDVLTKLDWMPLVLEDMKIAHNTMIKFAECPQVLANSLCLLCCVLSSAGRQNLYGVKETAALHCSSKVIELLKKYHRDAHCLMNGIEFLTLIWDHAPTSVTEQTSDLIQLAKFALESEWNQSVGMDVINHASEFLWKLAGTEEGRKVIIVGGLAVSVLSCWQEMRGSNYSNGLRLLALHARIMQDEHAKVQEDISADNIPFYCCEASPFTSP